MLTEKRYEIILNYVNENKIAKLKELMDITASSESTIRRDLSNLEEMKLLERVFGGAKVRTEILEEASYNEKSSKNIQEKNEIGKLAATFVDEHECIYIDAGTSTHSMIEFLKNKKNIIVVTNGINHATDIIENDIDCILIGGKIKKSTKAIVGALALKDIGRFRFDKAFMGANAIDSELGYMTPDTEEAMLKEKAISLSKKSYVLVDETKFDKVSFVKFADISKCTIITTDKNNLDKYKEKTQIKVVD